MEEKWKSAEILRGLAAQREEQTLLFSSGYDQCIVL
jgi:hypothetical protein